VGPRGRRHWMPQVMTLSSAPKSWIFNLLDSLVPLFQPSNHLKTGQSRGGPCPSPRGILRALQPYNPNTIPKSQTLIRGEMMASAGLFPSRICSACYSVSSRLSLQRHAPPQTTTSVCYLGAPSPPEFSLTSTLMQKARSWMQTNYQRAAGLELPLVGWRDTASPGSWGPPSSML
jgi:hypothetical protein